MKELERFGGIFVAPRRVFLGLEERPGWVAPFVVVLVVLSLSAALTVSFTREAILTRQREVRLEQGLTEPQIQQSERVLSGPIPVLSAGISTAIITGLLFLVAAGIYNLLVPLLGGTSSFRKVFSVFSYSALVLIPGSVLKVILAGVTRSPWVTTSLALFTPFLDRTSFGYRFLAGIDLFSIWHLVIFASGIAITNRLKRERSYPLVFSLWLIFILIAGVVGGIAS